MRVCVSASKETTSSFELRDPAVGGGDIERPRLRHQDCMHESEHPTGIVRERERERMHAVCKAKDDGTIVDAPFYMSTAMMPTVSHQ